MKTLLLSFIFTVSAITQTTTIYSWTFPALGAHDAPITVNVTYDNAVSLSNFILAQAAGTPTTLTAGVTATATSIPVANITGLVVGNGVCVSTSASTCNITASTSGTGPYTFSLTTGEVMQITAITPGVAPAGTLTVVRQTVGTAASYSSGQAVTFVKYGNNTLFALACITNTWQQIIANPQYASKSALAAQADIAAAQAALATSAATL